MFIQHFRGKLSWVGSRSTSKTVGSIGTLIVAALIVGAYVPSFPITGGKVDKFDVSFAGLTAGDTGSTSTGLDTSVGAKAIETLSWNLEEEGSGSFTAVSTKIQFFDKNTDPGSSTANPIDTITMTNGVGSTTNKKLKTNTDYRVVAYNDTAASWYDIDYGVMRFDGNDLTLNGVLSYDSPVKAQIVATLDDILNENATGGGGSNNGVMNGQTDTVLGTDEIGCSTRCGADGTFLYDESVGDQIWYIDVSPSASGANAVARDAVLVFKKDQTNPPEGDEYTSITAQLRTGTDFGLPSDITVNWKDEIPMSLGDIKAGQSATYRLTFNVVEANEDGSDDWTLRFDDLGDFLGKDVRNSVRATADTVTYGGSQA